MSTNSPAPKVSKFTSDGSAVFPKCIHLEFRRSSPGVSASFQFAPSHLVTLCFLVLPGLAVAIHHLLFTSVFSSPLPHLQRPRLPRGAQPVCQNQDTTLYLMEGKAEGTFSSSRPGIHHCAIQARYFHIFHNSLWGSWENAHTNESQNFCPRQNFRPPTRSNGFFTILIIPQI